jgi:hypothetical protein
VDDARRFYSHGEGSSGTHIALRWKGRLRFTVPREVAAQAACWKTFHPGPIEIPLRAMACMPRLFGAASCRENERLESIREAIGRDAGLSCCRDGGPGVWSKDTILLLDKVANRPVYIVKAGFGEAVDSLLQNEAAWLRDLGDRQLLTQHIPALICHRSGAESPFIAQCILSGSVDERLGQVQFDFLRKFQSQYSCTMRLEEAKFYEDLLSRLKDLRGRLAERWLARLELAMRKMEQSLSGKPILLVAAHNDFTPWNIRVDGGVARVFDWEYADREQLPLFDPLHFVLMPLALRSSPVAKITQRMQETLRLCNERLGKEYCYEADTQALAYLVKTCTLFLWGIKGEEVSHPVFDRYAQLIDHACQR